MNKQRITKQNNRQCPPAARGRPVLPPTSERMSVHVSICRLCMYVYIYIYIYMYISIHIIHIYLFVYLSISLSLCLSLSLSLYIYIYIYILWTYLGDLVNLTHGSFLIRRQRGHPGVVLWLVISNSAKN